MANIITLDLRDAPPAQGGGLDYVPPGTYRLRVDSTVYGNAKTSGRPMITISFRIAEGPHQGGRLNDRFTLPTNDKDSKFGLQRFHAFLLALGAKVSQTAFKLDLDSLENKLVTAEVVDNKMPASTSDDGRSFSERTVSRVAEYVIPTRAPATPAPAPAAPKPVAPVPAVVPAAAPVDAVQLPLEGLAELLPEEPLTTESSANGQDVGAEVDALFS